MTASWKAGCVALIGTSVLVGCSAERNRDRPTLPRDSAEVNIIEIPNEPAPRLRLDSAAFLVVADSVAPLYSVTYAKFDLRGQLWLANGRREIIKYDSLGRRLSIVGRPGEGPGEFQDLWDVFPDDGAVLAYDPPASRITEFGSGDSIQLHSLPVSFALPNGISLVGREIVGITYSPPEGRSSGPQAVGTARLLWSDTSWASFDTVATVPGRLYILNSLGLTISPRSPSVLSVASREHVFLGTTDAPEIRVFDRDRHLVRIIRLPRVSAVVSRSPDEGSPPPVFTKLVVTSDDTLWVRRSTPATAAFKEWDLVGPSGLLIGRVQTPAHLRITQVAAHRVVGVWEDANGVQTVRAFRILR